MDLFSTLLMVVLSIMLAMSLVAFCVHLSRSVREFRAGYEEGPQAYTL